MSVWVESAGGPLLVVPESVLGRWGGSTDDDGSVETGGDYGRACSVEGYIALVDVVGHHALVLGDEPASGPAVLFDSAGPGAEIEADNRLVIVIDPGWLPVGKWITGPNPLLYLTVPS